MTRMTVRSFTPLILLTIATACAGGTTPNEQETDGLPSAGTTGAGPGSTGTTSTSSTADGDATSDSAWESTSTATADASTGPVVTVGDGGESTTEGGLLCNEEQESLTSLGSVVASSEFDASFPASLSVDGDLSTSWFSDGQSAIYTWSLPSDHCLDRLVLRSNAQHAEPSFREGFGFGSVTIAISNSDGEEVLSELQPLDGTPDPDLDLDLGGVLGAQVVLSFSEPESIECGGFGELAIDGRAPM